MKKPDERGVSAVEFALILPVLVLILFGIVEFGLILYDQAVITNASREGARKGITFAETRPTVSEIQTVVTNYTSGNLVTFVSGTVSNPQVPTGPCTAFGNNLTVTVTYNYTFLVLSPIMGLFGGSWGSTLPLKASTTMRCE